MTTSDKDYKIGGKEYTINATEDLHALLSQLQSENTKLSEQLAAVPKLDEQLALWDKAKPYFAKAGKDVDYTMAASDVMKFCLADQYDQLDQVDFGTVKYLFDKVLLPLESEQPAAETKQAKPTDSKQQTKNTLKVVPTKVMTGSISAEKMGDLSLQQRMTGKISELA